MSDPILSFIWQHPLPVPLACYIAGHCRECHRVGTTHKENGYWCHFISTGKTSACRSLKCALIALYLLTAVGCGLTPTKKLIGHLTSARNSPASCQYSSNSPMTTTAVASSRSRPQRSSDFSSALEALSSADKSIEHYERIKRLCLLATFVALILHISRGFLIPIICFGIDRVHKIWKALRNPA